MPRRHLVNAAKKHTASLYSSGIDWRQFNIYIAIYCIPCMHWQYDAHRYKLPTLLTPFSSQLDACNVTWHSVLLQFWWRHRLTRWRHQRRGPAHGVCTSPKRKRTTESQVYMYCINSLYSNIISYTELMTAIHTLSKKLIPKLGR